MESCKINVLKNLITQGQLKTRFLEIELFSTAVHFVTQPFGHASLVSVSLVSPGLSGMAPSAKIGLL